VFRWRQGVKREGRENILINSRDVTVFVAHCTASSQNRPSASCLKANILNKKKQIDNIYLMN